MLRRIRCPTSHWYPAVCVGHVMATGRHAVEFTVVEKGYELHLGIARPTIDLEGSQCYDGPDFWAVSSEGYGVHNGKFDQNWPGNAAIGNLKLKNGCVVGLLLDCDAGTLTVKKNGVRIGVSQTGLTGAFCWSAAMADKTTRVRIAAADPATF